MNVYFVLDCSLDRVTLSAIKEGLLQLGNLLALSVTGKTSRENSFSIGICYVKRNSVSTCHELQILAKASNAFNLREFHQALAGSTEMLTLSNPFFEQNTGSVSISRQVSSLGALLQGDSSQQLWDPRASTKKIVFIACEFSESISTSRDTILEAARQGVLLQFVCLDRNNQNNGINNDCKLKSKTNAFTEAISSFENCSFQNDICDPWLLDKLVKRWFHEITRLGMETSIILDFPQPLLADMTSIKCDLRPRKLQLSNTMTECQTCRCHGAALKEQCDKALNGASPMTCPVTGGDLDIWDCQTNGLKIGSGTILYLPSFKNPPISLDLSGRKDPPVMKVLSRVRLATLSEGLLFGLPYALTSSTERLDNTSSEDKAPLVFAGLCQVLDSEDFGLLCTSKADLEEGKENPISCYYILLPTEGSLLVKKVVAAEELLPIAQDYETVIPENITNSVKDSLSKMTLENYNPLKHETGCHSKLTWLVKESLQVRTRSKGEAMRRNGRNLHINLPPIQQSFPSNAVQMQPRKGALSPPLGESKSLDGSGEHPSVHLRNPTDSAHRTRSQHPIQRLNENPNFPRMKENPNFPRQSLPTRFSNVHSATRSLPPHPVNPSSRDMSSYVNDRSQQNRQELRVSRTSYSSTTGGDIVNTKHSPLPLEFRSATAVLNGNNQENLPERNAHGNPGISPSSHYQKAYPRRRNLAPHNNRPVNSGHEPEGSFEPSQSHLTIAQRRALLETNRPKQ